MTWTWVEPFAGAAACAIRLVGGASLLLPPVAWMGGKRRLAPAILGAMGVPEGRPARVVLSDAGPWGWVWPLLLELEASRSVGAHLRAWSSEHPRALWERLAAQPPAEDLHERAAQWLWLQARSASGVPIWWDGRRAVAPNGHGGVSAPHFNTGQAARDGWTAEERARGCRGAWLASNGQGQSVPAGHKGLGGWACERFHGATPEPAYQKGTARGTTGGIVNPGTIADRIEAIAEAFRGLAWEVHRGDATEIAPLPYRPTWVYLDPPYQGATGYGWDCPRESVLVLARAWAAAGAVVAVSEAVPLELAGWHHLEITRPGGKPEWLTLSRAPVRVPERQMVLFGGGS